MNSVIRKFEIFPGFGQQELPTGKVLLMECQPYAEGVLHVWIQTETDQDLNPTSTRPARVYPTGGTPLPGETHLASILTPGGQVWHLYEGTGADHDTY